MNNSNQYQPEPLTRTQILIAMGVTAVILLVISKIWQKLDSVEILPVIFDFNAILLGLALALGIILGSVIIYYLWEDYRLSSQMYLELIIKPLAWPDLIWLGLLPGLSEELLFRGVILPALGFNTTALIFSSILFGVLHLSGAKQWSYAVWATIVGFVLGYAALVTGNLLVPIVAHVVTNFVSGCIWKAAQLQQVNKS